MENFGNSEGLFRDVSEVEDFKAIFGEKLRAALRYNYGICHIQALLGEIIDIESSKTEATLVSSVQMAIDESLGEHISPETISFLVRNALKEVLTDNSGEDEANTGLSVDDMENFGLTLPDDTEGSRGHSRGHRELPAGEELSF